MLPLSTNTSLVILLLTLSSPGCMSVTPVDKTQPVIKINKQQQQRFQSAINAMQHNRYSEARRILSALIAESPQLTGPHINLGILYIQQGDYTKAIVSLNQALSLSPDNSRIHNLLGYAYRKKGEFQHAEAAYKTAIKLEPGYSNAYLNLGILYDLYLYQPGKAIRHYEKYLSLTKDSDPTVKKWIAEIKLRLGDKQG